MTTQAAASHMSHSIRISDAHVRRRRALHNALLLGLAGTLICLGAPAQTTTPFQAPVTLREAARGLFAIGVGVSDRIAESPDDWPLLTAQFGIVTPENCMKPAAVQKAEGEFDFAQPDQFVDFATQHNLRLVGHCLVWAKDDRTPGWFFRDGDKPVSRELLLQRMKKHIDTVVRRYRGRIASWDVVNEALDDGANDLRPSGWVAACGDDFLVKAFEYAHAADPEALLIYNDYNNELPGKRDKMIRLIRSLKQRGAPVHAIGLQGHYELDYIPFQDLEATLAAVRELGVKLVVSELDIDVVLRSRWWADGGKYREELAKYDPYHDGCPPEILQRQADQYAQLFQLFARYADVIERVSFWNLHDGQSWLNTFPWTRTNYPLLFDRQRQPKPACGAVIRALQEQPRDTHASRFFGIHVVDEETGRGVPLVELETVHHLRYLTDSAGWIAVEEPELMDRRVFFSVKSHGYTHAKDGFGFAGLVLVPVPGSEAEVRVRRTNVAQRLYRITGEGIYRDSLLLGKPIPLRDPQSTGQVVGQDSTSAVLYRDRIFWFWGDTNRLSYPLGHFWMAGATSDLPGAALDPHQGINLKYFVDDDGFSRPMARLGVESGPVWIDAVCVLPDEQGRERLVCHYAHMKDLGEVLDHGLAVYNDEKQLFEKSTSLEMNQLWRFPGQAHPIRQREGAEDYLYLGEVFPTVRVRATLANLADDDGWQAWTCLEPGSDAANPRFTRDASGRLEFGWRENARPVDIALQQKWLQEGKIQADEACFVPRDVDSGQPVRLHRGSVAWNAYRQKWIMIAGEQGGTSLLGEIWYAEAPRRPGLGVRQRRL